MKNRFIIDMEGFRKGNKINLIKLAARIDMPILQAKNDAGRFIYSDDNITDFVDMTIRAYATVSYLLTEEGFEEFVSMAEQAKKAAKKAVTAGGDK